MRKSNLTSNVLMAIAILAITALCIPQHLYAKAGASVPGVTIDDAAVITTGDINLQGFFTIHEGDVCSRQGDIDLGKSKKVTITSSNDPNWVVSVQDPTKTLTCKKGDLTSVYSTLISTNPQCLIFNTSAPGLTCPSDPTVMFPAPFPVVIGDTICGNGSPITPGDYNNVTVPKGEVCVFNGPGIYNMKSLTAIKASEIVFNSTSSTGNTCNPSDRFDIFIEEFARFMEGATVNRDEINPVYINVAGEDGSYGKRNRCPKGIDGKGPAALCIDGDGHEFNVCWAYVPAGTVSVGGYVDIKAQLFSKHLNQKGKLNVTLTLPNPDCCVPPPPEPPDCACYIDFGPVVASAAAGTEITMNGHNFIDDPSIPKRTVDYVLFYPSTDDIPGDPLGPDVGGCRVANPELLGTTLKFKVPATCPVGLYRLVLLNVIQDTPPYSGPWCSNANLLLQVNP